MIWFNRELLSYNSKNLLAYMWKNYLICIYCKRIKFIYVSCFFLCKSNVYFTRNNLLNNIFKIILVYFVSERDVTEVGAQIIIEVIPGVAKVDAAITKVMQAVTEVIPAVPEIIYSS